MIVFNLLCIECDYSFEGWFDNTLAFNKQKKNKLISCPNCESLNIKKALVAPNLGKKSNSKIFKNQKTLASNIKKIKKIVEENFDYVGGKFTDEAKKIKYGETNDRPIYGEATIDQAKELIEEEIKITTLPFQSSKKNN
ncbi:MAG: DUF1178 family protein [Pelagibacteraceae bacterium]|jgi:hypothetical protein|nr:DUF1178 family protein [Pelagibacteraceae bacterium]MBT3902254.1 DUF1178 family protein [Pelagibacteraceae bacterium]MBT6197541.1 DUF1178 family protein [Pelagibacteraceae bacterium]MBT6354131.1 DUF1178 family protein [Pelagibacteraceae bacterium]